jgi:hypothetical protein
MNVQMKVQYMYNDNSSTRSHASEVENRTRNRSKNCKYKRAFPSLGVCTTEYRKNLHVPYLLSNVYSMVP